uniref:hypothetical protein n=1 Tax=Acinetobacter baumannii TaxID=470 RepID=UPI00131D7249
MRPLQPLTGAEVRLLMELRQRKARGVEMDMAGERWVVARELYDYIARPPRGPISSRVSVSYFAQGIACGVPSFFGVCYCSVGIFGDTQACGRAPLAEFVA